MKKFIKKVQGFLSQKEEVNINENIIEKKLNTMDTITSNNINLDYLMSSLKEWRANFINRKKYLNKRLTNLDLEEINLKNEIDSLPEGKERREKTLALYRVLNEKKSIVKEKNLIRKLDENDELSYEMIGKKLQNYKYYTSK